MFRNGDDSENNSETNMTIENVIIRAARLKLEELERAVVNGVSKYSKVDFYGVDVDDPVPLRLQILGLTDVRFIENNGLTPEEEKVLWLIDTEAEGMFDPEFLTWECWEEGSDFLSAKNRLLALYQKLGLDVGFPAEEYHGHLHENEFYQPNPPKFRERLSKAVPD